MSLQPNAPHPSHSAKRPSDGGKSLSDRLAYIGLDESDQQRLRELAPHFEQFATDFVDAFYRHLFQFDQAARFLRDPELVARLKQRQREHFSTLLAADWDASYVARRYRVGNTHADIGIEPELFLGAYNQYLQQSFRRYLESTGTPPSPQIEGLLSLLKAVFLDLGLTLEAYFSRSTGALQQALDMYWKANVELRQFAHLASHDLKTPLATVANFCDEALDEFGAQMPEEARNLIASARQRTFRMSTMIDELLATATSFDEAREVQDVSSQVVLAEAAERLRPEMSLKQIVLEIPETLPVVWGDPVRLRESFYNLLSNAVKFIQQKPGKITITAATDDNEIELVFADNGPGIPAEDLEHVFAPFRRSTHHNDCPGSGLGLYFTKTMIEHVGGRVWVESVLGEGSRFHVVLRKPPHS